jgi:hypothetical protein
MWARWWIQQVHIHCEIEELMERFCVTMNTAGCQSKCWFFCHLFSSTTSFLTCKMTITSKMRALLSTQDSTYRKIYATKKKSLWVLFEVPSSQLRTFEATENPFLTCSNMVNLGRKVSDAPNCPHQAHLKLQIEQFAVDLMRRHTSKNRKSKVACLLKSRRKKEMQLSSFSCLH